MLLIEGCHPVGACHYRGSPRRDTSHAAEAVVNKLNKDDARTAALVSISGDFGYSHDLLPHGNTGRHPCETPRQVVAGTPVM